MCANFRGWYFLKILYLNFQDWYFDTTFWKKYLPWKYGFSISKRNSLWWISSDKAFHDEGSLHDNFSITPKTSKKIFSHPKSRTFGRPSLYFIEIVDFWTVPYVFPGVCGGKIRKQLGWPLTNELQSSFCNL